MASKVGDILIGVGADIGPLQRGLGKAGQSVDGFGGRVGKARSETQRFTSVATKAAGVLAGALAAAFSVRAVVNYSDTWSDLSSRVGIAVRDMDKSPEVMARISDMARRTYSDLGQTAEGFLRNATTLRELGLSTDRALDFTEALNNAMVVSGAKGQQAERVQRALSAAMATGTLRGDNLNTMLEAGGRVTELLAERLGTTTLGLRQMATEGKITSEVITDTLLDSLVQLREEAEEMPATIGDGFTLLGNALLAAVGQFDQATGASETLAGVLVDLADYITEVSETAIPAFIDGLEMLATGMIGLAATQIPGIILALTNMTAAAGLAAAAMRALGVAVSMAGGPLGIAVGLLAAGAAHFLLFRDEADKTSPAVRAAEEAQHNLNKALGVFSETAAPEAAGEAVGFAQAMVTEARAALEAAEAHYELMAAREAAGNALLDENPLTAGGQSGYAEAMRRNTDAALAEVNAARARIEEAHAKLNNTIRQVTGEDVFQLPGITFEGGGVMTPGRYTPRPKARPPLVDEMGRGRGGGAGGLSSAEQLAEELEQRLEVLMAGLQTEDEVVAEWYETSLETLREARERGMLTEQEYMDQRERLEEEHQKRLAQIRGMSEDDQLAGTKAFLGDMASALSSGGDKMLKISKAFGAAQALISAWQGAAKALELPFPANMAAFAKVLATGMSAVQAIQSVGKGGTGGRGGRGGTSAAAPAQQAMPSQVVRINMTGDVMGRDGIKRLFDQINTGLRDGHRLERVEFI